MVGCGSMYTMVPHHGFEFIACLLSGRYSVALDQRKFGYWLGLDLERYRIGAKNSAAEADPLHRAHAPKTDRSDLLPAVAKAFIKDMRAYFAEPNAIKRDEIAARQLRALHPYDPSVRPSIRRWRDHSAGRSARRVTPMPWGSRPSIAALTRSGARKASEMVMFTLRTLHP